MFTIFFFFLIMVRYRLDSTKYVIKESKKHQKVPKSYKKLYPHCLTPPPLRLIHFFKINNIHLKEFFIHIRVMSLQCDTESVSDRATGWH